ncbi:MAG: phage terminase, small subunit, family [Sporolactobacillus laevolacticus]|jgi:phage terminase small subunit|nr:phage terminase, small subunit, family [Sporolactobacillus laevolacticus]
MPRKRDPRRDQAFKIWKQHQGKITNREIANQLDVPEKTISAWKSRDKWNAVLQKNDCSTTKRKGTKQARAPSKKEIKEPIAESVELTEKQRLFCLYYLKSFNATQAAIKAGYSIDTAHVQGPRLLSNVRVAEHIREVKGKMHQELFIDAMDVLNKYIQIAFADITDYVEFGNREMTKKEIVDHDGDGNPVFDESTESYSFVDLKDSNCVDGSLINEVKQGRDGVSIKLADKMKALDMLSKYFDLLSKTQQEKLRAEKIKADTAKAQAETTKLKGEDDDDYEDDGFLDALNGKTADVWNDYSENESSGESDD